MFQQVYVDGCGWIVDECEFVLWCEQFDDLFEVLFGIGEVGYIYDWWD